MFFSKKQINKNKKRSLYNVNYYVLILSWQVWGSPTRKVSLLTSCPQHARQGSQTRTMRMSKEEDASMS